MGRWNVSDGSILGRRFALSFGCGQPSGGSLSRDQGSLQGVGEVGGVAAPGIVTSGISQTTAGRCTMLMRRRAGKWTITHVRPGTNSNGAAAHPNASLEFIGIRKGTFSDADITNILASA